MKLSWNQPCCERCWAEDKGVRIIDDVDQMVDPIRVTNVTEAEKCAFCGFPTWVGIWIRQDPATVPYPHKDSDE